MFKCTIIFHLLRVMHVNSAFGKLRFHCSFATVFACLLAGKKAKKMVIKCPSCTVLLPVASPVAPVHTLSHFRGGRSASLHHLTKSFQGPAWHSKSFLSTLHHLNSVRVALSYHSLLLARVQKALRGSAVAVNAGSLISMWVARCTACMRRRLSWCVAAK